MSRYEILSPKSHAPPGRYEVVEWSPRQAVDALPDFLTRTPFEKQNDHLRYRKARDLELAELGLEGSRVESAAIGAYDGLSLGNYAPERSSKALYPTYASMPFIAQIAGALDKHGVLPDWAGGGQADNQEAALRGFQSQQTEARRQNPWSYMGGEVGGYLAPGGGVLASGSKLAKTTASNFLNPKLAMKGDGALPRLTRYLQSSVAPASIAGGVDYGIYEATIGENSRAAEEQRTPTLSDRFGAFREGVTSPEGYMFGAAASPVYRAGRGAASIATGGRISMTPLPQKQWAANLQQRNTPQARAYEMVAKRLKQDGVTTDQLREAIKNYHYAGYSSVDEMLFELAEVTTKDKGGGKLKQLAVALGSVGGDAQQTARANFNTRKAEMPSVLREELRKAVGLEGSDFYKYGEQIRELQRTLPGPFYDDAYARSISDEAWQKQLWPSFKTSPSSQQAIVDAYNYARDLGELEVAGEIAELLPGIGRTLDDRTGAVVRAGASAPAGIRQAVPTQPSTQAFDFIDRMLGDSAESLRGSATKRAELAKGPSQAQARLRSVVDEATNLNLGRDKAAELFAAERALEFGEQGFKRGVDLETLQNQFARQSGRYGGEHIDPALLMGWIKGAETAIETATNPGTVMRQIYGSERQRAKLLAMLPDGAALGPGFKADKTKRMRTLVGGKRDSGVTVDGRFNRMGRMLASENEIVGNSQTGQRHEAVASQGGLQRLANTVADAVIDPRQTINKGIRAGVNRATRPGIFNEKINRELGDIMFTGGKENLERIVDELDNMQRRPLAKLPLKGGGGRANAGEADLPQKRVASNGLPMLPGSTLQGGVVGATAGGLAPAENNEERLRNIALGGALGAGSGRLDSFLRPTSSKISTLGIGGRRRKDVMREATRDNLPAVRSDLPQIRSAPSNAPRGLPRLPQKGSSAMDGPLPILGAIGTTGAGAFALSHLIKPEAANAPAEPADLESIRQGFMNDYAEILTNVSAREGLVEFRMARIQQMDRLMDREARRNAQSPAPPEIERARQKILDSLVKKIRHAPMTDLSSYYDKLDRVDALIASGGVPAVRPVGVPPTPSLKPALPQ